MEDIGRIANGRFSFERSFSFSTLRLSRSMATLLACGNRHPQNFFAMHFTFVIFAGTDNVVSYLSDK
jgi:hypothetical protein